MKPQSKPQDISTLNKKADEKLNDRLISVYNDIAEIKLSRKQLAKNMERNLDRTDHFLRCADSKKKATLYNSMKSLSLTISKVGPAYSRIINQKKRAEMKNNKSSPSRQKSQTSVSFVGRSRKVSDINLNGRNNSASNLVGQNPRVTYNNPYSNVAHVMDDSQKCSLLINIVK